MAASRPIEAVRTGFRDILERYGEFADVQAVGVTGSGRHLIGDLAGADVVVNEITAHATASAFICPEVDTIFEIGGQDSKYVRLEGGLVKDFTMNKACAAGTGSFLEEQAEKLGISIKRDFARLALAAEHPVDCGEQCTVFIDSEVVRHQQRGTPVSDIAGGLAYSIATNYLHRVVEKRPVGDHILFQGGVAFNTAVLAAFERLTGKTITVPPHNEVMGAIGCCLIARRKMLETPGFATGFTGFGVLEKDTGRNPSSAICVRTSAISARYWLKGIGPCFTADGANATRCGVPRGARACGICSRSANACSCPPISRRTRRARGASSAIPVC